MGKYFVWLVCLCLSRATYLLVGAIISCVDCLGVESQQFSSLEAKATYCLSGRPRRAGGRCLSLVGYRSAAGTVLY